MKRNNQNPGTFLMSPRQGHQIIQGIRIVIRTGGRSFLSSKSTKRLWEALLSRNFPATGLRI
ncbi:unnamed protein product [Brassica rapa]|uniref:Uncharacterized protein n=1 Tax=Brassica campestris TaxID=3711 RepID=A0A3P6AWF3_BRACM|nr:unnamed protein product [Brassica rapa]VDC90020.1 unnamed protein product [Brassica rapa]